MNIREIYEKLVEGNRVTLNFSCKADYISVYAQLRTYKSRYDAQFSALTGQSLSDGKVIRTDKLDTEKTLYRFSLADKKVCDKIQFEIIDIEPAENNESGDLPFNIDG